LYLGGWATAAKGSESEDPGADLANYALDRVPKEGGSWVRALLHQDEVQRSSRIRITSLKRKKTPAIEFNPPMIIPDGDTGHGGEHHIRNLVKKFVENKIGAIHIEDQRPGCKVCGHQGQKVLVSTTEIISRLNTARLQFDIMKVPGVIVARTDSHDATAIDSVEDERDHPFVYGATNPHIVPFKNVNLAVIRKFYEEGFKEINGHLLHGISEEAYKHAGEWLKQERLTKRIAEGVEKINNEVATLKRIRQQDKAKLPMPVDRWKKFAKGVSHEEARARAKSMDVDTFWDWDLPRTPEGLYQVTGGREMAIARGLAMAPFADLVWRETAKPDLEDDKDWADAIHAVFPHKML